MVHFSNQGRTHVSFDWALKRLLRNKADHQILEGFLSELLKQDIKVNRLLESESNAERADDKVNRVDVLCENEQQELVIIELQYHRERDYFQRILFGVSRLVSEYLRRGAPYDAVRKIYSVHILYFDLGQGDDYIYHGFLRFNGLHKADELSLSRDQQEKYGKREVGALVPEFFLLKINNFDEVATDTLDEWIYYLKTSKLPGAYKARGLAAVDVQLKFDAMTPELKAKYQKYLDANVVTESQLEAAYESGIAEGKYVGKQEGRQEGRQEEQERLVLNATHAGYSADAIASLLGLSTDRVQAILSKPMDAPDL